jgi:hypothetical protein
MPTPDYHFLYIEPTLGADWFFTAARRYWERFRPLVVSDFDLISFIPPRRSLAITTLARRDLAKKIADDIKKNFPRAYHDPLVYDFVEEMQMTLDGRADLQQQFGVPDSEYPPRRKGS